MSCVAIIDYGSGNLRSVAKAFEYVASRSTIRVTCDPAALMDASHIVLPGVGAYGDCMAGLSALPGMLEALSEQVLAKKKWFLGVCVGMQMLFERGHEHGTHTGLGWLPGEVVRLAPQPTTLKVPHMGWNDLEIIADHPVLQGVEQGTSVYFIHSYHAKATQEHILATSEYGDTIVAMVAKDNVIGTQFHPEKSQATGLRLLQNFIEL